MSVTVKLPVFEGPLDLLLHLIEKNQVDICDIPIYEITKQYLEYLDEWNHENMIIASEFIVMAATLIKIKARMLIPSEPKEEDEDDPREDLIRRLLEYKRFKEAAKDLKKLIPDPDHLWVIRSKENIKIPAPKPDIRQLLEGQSLEGIYELYRQALQNKADSIDPTRSTFNSVAKDSYTIDSKIRDLLETLEHLQTISFYQLRKQSHSRQEEITYFLAMLELNRSSLVYLKQENPFEDILMMPADQEQAESKIQEDQKEPEDREDQEEEPSEEKQAEPEPQEQLSADKPLETELQVQPNAELPLEIEPQVQPNVELPLEIEPQVQPNVELPLEIEPQVQPSAEMSLETVLPAVAAMTVSIPTIIIEPSIPLPQISQIAEVTEEAEASGIAEAEVETTVDSEVVDTTEVEADTTVDSEVVDTTEVEADTTIDSEVVDTTEVEADTAVDSEVVDTTEVEVDTAVDSEVVDTTEVEVVTAVDSNVLEVDFASAFEIDPTPQGEDGSEYTERTIEDERGYSDPKKARAAGA